MFEEIINIASNKLACVYEKVVGLPEPQATVLFTDNNFYISVNDIDGLICDELKSKNDTKIVYMLTMWKSGHIDLSPIKFRKALIELDELNHNTDILLQGNDGLITKKLSATMP